MHSTAQKYYAPRISEGVEAGGGFFSRTSGRFRVVSDEKSEDELSVAFVFFVEHISSSMRAWIPRASIYCST